MLIENMFGGCLCPALRWFLRHVPFISSFCIVKSYVTFLGDPIDLL